MKKNMLIPQYPWGWRSMWIIIMFDLPTDTPNARKIYAQFRNSLLKDGFTMMQYSIYIRHCASIENAEVHIKRMEKVIPPNGEVRFLVITDKQYARIRVYIGKKRQKIISSISQLQLF